MANKYLCVLCKQHVSKVCDYYRNCPGVLLSFWGPAIAQWVERRTEMPGIILTRVRVPGAARDFSPRVNFQCGLSYGVRTEPRVQSHASAFVRTVKITNTGSHTIVWTHENTTAHKKILLYTLIEMGSAALAAAVPYPGKATGISP